MGQDIEWQKFTNNFVGAILRSHLRVIELTEELFLVHDGVDWAFRDDASLCHLFHRKKFLFFAELYSPHFAKAASSNDKLQIEVVPIDL